MPHKIRMQLLNKRDVILWEIRQGHCRAAETHLVQEMLMSRLLPRACLSVTTVLTRSLHWLYLPFFFILSLIYLSGTFLCQAYSSPLSCCPYHFLPLYILLNPSLPPVPLLNTSQPSFPC